MTTTTISVESVRFVKELYPRLEPSDATIDSYRTAIDRLPPIVVARDGILVDGYHRWQAHVREGIGFIEAENLGALSDDEIFRESIIRNATHGHQLSMGDKRKLAGALWPRFKEADRSNVAQNLADWLSVSRPSVERWTKDQRASEKLQLQSEAWDLWLDCLTEHQIGERLATPRTTIQGWIDEKRQLMESVNEPPDPHMAFDYWVYGVYDADSSYFGKLHPGVIENLLWLYTDPGQTVVDLFAGSGMTIKVAKQMSRRVWASDRRGNYWDKTLPIHEHDALDGWPADAPARADIVLLDPPYWQQAKGRYSDDLADLANQSLDEFNASWDAVAKIAMNHSSRVAYIISPTQREDGTVVDHATDMLGPFFADGWRVERRIIVPYNTQQATGQQVIWARENKKLLKLYRDLVVMTR